MRHSTWNVSDADMRRKLGYVRPSLRAGLVDDGDTIGMLDVASNSCDAAIEASEQPAPTMALTPRPPKAVD
eukprot:26126-Prymnesium_polylepis.2